MPAAAPGVHRGTPPSAGSSWPTGAISLFLAVLPFILGTLALLVPGDVGLGIANPRGDAADEPVQIVFLLSISAVFMGTALTIRDLVGERTIFRREQAVGLSATAYLLAKIVVYCVTAAAQTAVLTTIVVVGKGAPTRGAVVLGNPILELYLTLAATAAVAAVMGLAMSAAAKSQDQILPMLVISVMLSIVFCGGMIPVTGRLVLDQVSWAIPARWGFAATASTTDLRTIAPLLQTKRDAVVAPRWLVAARHDRTDPRGSRPGRLRALAHPAQRGSTNSRSHRLVSMVHAAGPRRRCSCCSPRHCSLGRSSLRRSRCPQCPSRPSKQKRMKEQGHERHRRGDTSSPPRAAGTGSRMVGPDARMHRP